MEASYSNFKILVFASLIFANGCQQNTDLESELKPRVVVAIDATFIPMSFMNTENQLDGFEVDLIKEVTQDANLEYELVNVEWGGLFGGLITGKFDLVISSVGIIEERKKRMAFSIPYVQSGVAVLVLNNMTDIESLEDLEKQNATVGAQINTTSHYFLEKYSGINIKTFEKFGHAVIDLANKGVDAVVGDSVQANYYFRNNKNLADNARFVGSRMTSEFYGIVFRKEDEKLKNKINASLTRLLKNGTVSRLHQKWELGEFATVPNPDM
jgi:polar amino acid transport system substrate-binding protein